MTDAERIAELEAKLAEYEARQRPILSEAAHRITELEAKLAEAELRIAQERNAKDAAAAAVVDLNAKLVALDSDAANAKLALAAAESREKALREALTHAVAWFWGAEPEGTVAARDRVAAEFYAETGFIAPGKDVPPVMNPSWTEEERRAAWDVWVKRKRDALEAECRAALAAGRKTGSECVNGCHKPVCPPSRVLCADCFAELDRKMQALAAGKETP